VFDERPGAIFLSPDRSGLDVLMNSEIRKRIMTVAERSDHAMKWEILCVNSGHAGGCWCFRNLSILYVAMRYQVFFLGFLFESVVYDDELA